ncbi:MAG UNVERIFIED_CONTAM: hypothetical protein LVT10_18415 [Anaerolineae bacterium]
MTGTLNTQTPPLRYVFQGLPGDLVDVVGTVSEGDLTPELVIRDETYRVISTSTPTPPDYRAVALIPQRGWYLLEVNPVSGAGTLTLRVQALAGQTVSIDDTQPLALEGPFTVAQPSSVYLFEGKIGTQLFIPCHHAGRNHARPHPVGHRTARVGNQHQHHTPNEHQCAVATHANLHPKGEQHHA